MIEDEYRRSSAFRCLNLVHFFQKRSQPVRIESSFGQEADGHDIGFGLLIRAVSKKRSIDTERNAESRELVFPGITRRQTRRDRDRSLYKKLPGKLGRPVAGGNVSDLVSENGRHFGIVGGHFNQAAIDINRSPGETEGVQLFRVHDPETVLKCRQRRTAHDALSDTPEIPVQVPISNERQCLLGFFRCNRANLHVLLEREEVDALPAC